jgi:hypothetical protein
MVASSVAQPMTKASGEQYFQLLEGDQSMIGTRQSRLLRGACLIVVQNLAGQTSTGVVVAYVGVVDGGLASKGSRTHQYNSADTPALTAISLK